MFPSFIGIVLSIFFIVIDISLLNTSDLLISLKHKKYKDIIYFLLLLYLILVFVFALMPLPIFLITELSIVPLFFSYAIQTINSLRRTNLKYSSIITKLLFIIKNIIIVGIYFYIINNPFLYANYLYMISSMLLINFVIFVTHYKHLMKVGV
ncbi:MAG: hypothetical protein ACK5HS_01600 [Mycoplasmatales bacterium]